MSQNIRCTPRRACISPPRQRNCHAGDEAFVAGLLGNKQTRTTSWWPVMSPNQVPVT